MDVCLFEDTIEFGDKIHWEAIRVANSEESLNEEFFNHLHGENEQLMEKSMKMTMYSDLLR